MTWRSCAWIFDVVWWRSARYPQRILQRDPIRNRDQLRRRFRGPARPPILCGELGNGHHAFSMPLCSEPSRSRRCAPTPRRGASDLDGPCAQRVPWPLRDGRLNTPTLRRVTRDRPRSHSGLLQQDRRAYVRGGCLRTALLKRVRTSSRRRTRSRAESADGFPHSLDPGAWPRSAGCGKKRAYCTDGC